MATNSHTFTINGIGPMLMHCGQTADPLNHFAKAMKKQSAKRNKTDDDLAALSLLEWWAGLYTDVRLPVSESGEVVAPPDAKLILPAHVLDSAIREGARKIKAGKQISAGVIVEGPAIFKAAGVKNLNDASKDETFHYRTAVKVSTSKVMRTRPIFNEWHAEFTVCLDSEVVDLDIVRQSLEAAGRLVGVGDWRPGAPKGGSFGRFIVA
jgi:hypothetical protein